MKILRITILTAVAALMMAVPVRANEYTERELFARVVEAEAGNQGMVGKRLVASVILNRVDSDKFPNTVTEVLTEPHQFATVSKGVIDKVDVSDETMMAVILEYKHRTDDEILYFNCGPCSGKYAYTYGGHQFGK